MSDREKLIELLEELEALPCGYTYQGQADHLISNGVTVGVDAKPLKQYLTQIDEYAGLKLKFLVFKADTGERIENCFVLRPDKDAAAVEALRAYANATDNETLAEDIYNWVGNGVTVQKWIPVSERLPEDDSPVLVARKNGDVDTDMYIKSWWKVDPVEQRVTHWMPLPKPPKECE